MRDSKPLIHVIGGGLAGSEASWQLLQAGFSVVLHEMRPAKLTPAHQTGHLAELVCSNSLKSTLEDTAPGLLKREMAALNSLIIESAYAARVPAGMALAVDRIVFSNLIEEKLRSHRNFTLEAAEVLEIPTCEDLARRNEYYVLCTGPLTSEAMSQEILKLTGQDKGLHFYDAIAPVLEADSIDFSKGVFTANRWDKGTPGSEQTEGDYLNIPLSREEYEAFVKDILAAEKMPLHEFEQVKYFESCLPIEVMAERGLDTLRFGPMKPVGITDPRTGRWPYANIQLRQENVGKTMFSMVGFQTKMKWPEQKRVFSKLPGLRDVDFFRYGSVHRNTYIESPKYLTTDLSFKSNERVFLAGQITGVEGYTESAAIGLLAGRFAAAKASGSAFQAPPQETMIGALLHYVTHGTLGPYQPMNTNLGLLPPIPKEKGVSKTEKKAKQVDAAWKRFSAWKVDSNFGSRHP